MVAADIIWRNDKMAPVQSEVHSGEAGESSDDFSYDTYDLHCYNYAPDFEHQIFGDELRKTPRLSTPCPLDAQQKPIPPSF